LLVAVGRRLRARALVVPALAVVLVPVAAPAEPLRVASAKLPASSAPVKPGSPKAAPWPRAEVLDAARRAYDCGRAQGHFQSPLLTVIDYSLPSTEPRLWVLDLDAGKVLFHELVAHGLHSGDDRTVAFSNVSGSKMTSLGLFRTAETYIGKHGHSLRLDGLEPGFNEAARERAIVMHGADYVDPDIIPKLGRLGRSWGCPAVRREVSDAIIERIQGGTALFAWYPHHEWLGSSAFLRCDSDLQQSAAASPPPAPAPTKRR